LKINENKKKINQLFLFLFDKSLEEMKEIEDFKRVEKWDSLNFAGLIVGLQKEFKVKIGEGEFKEIQTFSGLKNFLNTNGIKIN